MPDLLLELLSEEIPARMQARAADDLRRLVTDALAEAGLPGAGARAFATPRRLALAVQGLAARSPLRREERKGPRVDAPEAALAGFLRGQATVIVILAVYYATALTLVGLPFGVVVGVVTGAISFIPYVGAIIGGALSLGLAAYAFWGDPVWIVAVLVIFVAGQALEGNVLVPKLVGDHIGVHPVWLLLALSVFGSLFGFVGMLVAVPVSAVLGVLVRFAVARYRASALFRGSGEGTA